MQFFHINNSTVALIETLVRGHRFLLFFDPRQYATKHTHMRCKRNSMCEIYNKTHDLGLVDIHGDKECRHHHHFLFLKETYLSFSIACLHPVQTFILIRIQIPDSLQQSEMPICTSLPPCQAHRFWIQSAKQFSGIPVLWTGIHGLPKTKRNACIMGFLGVQRSCLRAWRKSNLLKYSEPPLNFFLMDAGIGITEGSQNGIFKLLVVRPGISLTLKWKGN